MIRITRGFNLQDPIATSMFDDRKRLFVDLLGWDVPVKDDRFEIDAFDDAHATYITAVGQRGEHVGSMRLLPTTRQHILGSLFATLCDDPVPAGHSIFEITRLCLPVRLGASGRLATRNRLISAMVDHALLSGITTLTGVVAWSFLEQILLMGWRCEPLGRPTMIEGSRLGAFRIDLDDHSSASLAATGIYTPGTLAAPVSEAA